ncbi:MAG: cytochrome P450 [Acidimicrobiales bacterium]
MTGADDDIDLAGREANDDPSGFARRVLADGPIRWSDTHRGWLLLGYRAVSDGFRDTRLSADRITSLERLARERPEHFALTVELLSGWMIFRDPPAHTRLRDPVRRAITPRTVDRLGERIDATITELLDELSPGDELDFKERIAGPLPALIIADMLGVPGAERHRFKSWSDDLAKIVFSVEPGSVPVDDLRGATEEFTTFFGDLLQHRRRHPGDDLISDMVKGGADELTSMELIGACTLLLFAGHETTTNLLTSSLRLFNDHPDQRRRLIEDPSVATTAADELLRVVGPAKAMVRRVGVDHERNGHRFERGQRVYLVILTANRDPDVFDDPEVVDLGRDPNPQLGFGWGLHHCLGAPLARLEASITLTRLYERFGDLELLDPERQWSGNALGRGFGRLPIRV